MGVSESAVGTELGRVVTPTRQGPSSDQVFSGVRLIAAATRQKHKQHTDGKSEAEGEEPSMIFKFPASLFFKWQNNA